MKAYTDLNQSKKLAEILPHESADMLILNNVGRSGDVDGTNCHTILKENLNPLAEVPEILPCWSLAALLDVMPISCDDGRHCLSLINSNPNGEVDWLCCYEGDNGNLMMECYGNNQIDACYEMIIKLKENNLL